MLVTPALYVVGGLLLAWGIVTIDGRLGNEGVPEAMRFGAENARVLLSSLIGAFLTVVALVFWVRMMAVQMASDEFSSRLLRPFLVDNVQQQTMGSVMGGLAYCLFVLRAVPGQGAGLPSVPHLAVGLAALLSVLVAGLIIVAVHSGSRRTQIGWLVRSLAEDTVNVIRTYHPELGATGSEAWLELGPPEPPDKPAQVVRAATSGWVQAVREDTLLKGLDPGSTAELRVRAGVFVVEHTTLARVWDGNPETVERAVRNALPLGVDPSLGQDVSHGIRQLCDIAERALAPSGGDSTTVREVIVHVGLVLRALLLRDLPAPTRTDEHDRTLLRPRELSLREHVDLALFRLRIAATQWPGISETLLDTLRMLIEELEEHDLRQRADHLRHHAALIVESIERQEALKADRRRVRDFAERFEMIPSEG